MQLVRVRSKEGTHRIEVNPTDDIAVLRNKVRRVQGICMRQPGSVPDPTEMHLCRVAKSGLLHDTMLTFLLQPPCFQCID